MGKKKTVAHITKIRRKICHRCGYEVTNKPIYLIWCEDTKQVLQVCKLCKVKEDYAREQKKRK